jgi:UDP:flavonoid glycosyltransferase YjiC (YdhE family)
MRLRILTLGSRGDVQPYVALARGLATAGYDVALCAAPSFRSFIEAHGVAWRCFDTGDPRALLQSEEGRALVAHSQNPIALVRGLMRMLEPLLEKGYQDAAQCAADADALIVAPTALAVAQSLHEKSGLPVVGAFLQPGHPTREFGSWLFPDVPDWLPFAGALRKLSHRVTTSLLFRLGRRGNDRGRERVLGLGPARNPFAQLFAERWPTLYGFSRTVVPRPSDWGAEIDVTGYWFLSSGADFRPPARLSEFLDAGPPPICVGFGSMPAHDAALLTREVLRGIELAGRRALLLTGWGALAPGELPDSVLALDATPHDWLFPRVAAVVHHGGAGTTAAALRAGVPSLVVPFIADQKFWGDRVAALGAGPRPISQRRLTAERFAAALRELDSDRYRDAARAVGRALSAEDGLGRAAAALPF